MAVKPFAAGPAHTAGDEAIYVKGDGVLFPGDIVQDRVVPNLGCDRCSPRSWQRIAALKSQFIASDHGNLGGPDLILQERGFFKDLERYAQHARNKGLVGEEVVKAVADRMSVTYSAGGMVDVAKRAVAERP